MVEVNVVEEEVEGMVEEVNAVVEVPSSKQCHSD